MAKTPTEICCAIENNSLQIGEKGFYTIAIRLLCEIAQNISNTDDTEILCLCDDQGGGTIVPFVRIVTVDSGGTVTTADFELDGVTPYVPSGTVGKCTGGSGDDSEIMCLCDNQGGGVIVPFLRIITAPGDGGPLVIADFELDGVTPYVTSGTVEKCESEAPDDHEVLCLCDDQGGGTIVEFLRRLVVDAAGVVTLVDTELDGTTAYVVLGTVIKCSAGGGNQITAQDLCVNAESIETQEILVFSGSPTGTVFEYTLNPTVLTGNTYVASTPGGPSGLAINNLASEIYIIIGSAAGSQVIETATWPAGGFVSQFALAGVTASFIVRGLDTHPVTGVLWGIAKFASSSGFELYTVDPTTGAFTLFATSPFTDFSTSSASFTFDSDGRLFVGGFNGVSGSDEVREFDPITLADKGLVTQLNGGTEQAIGITSTQQNTLLFRGIPMPEYTQGGIRINQYPAAGNPFNTDNFESIPLANGLGAGSIIKRICVVDSAGTIVNTIDYDVNGNVIDTSSIVLEACCCDGTVAVGGEGSNNLGVEILNVTDAGVVPFASIPNGAEGATIQVQVTAGTGAVRFFADGVTSPTISSGIRVVDLGSFPLGIVRDFFGGDPLELTNFEVIAETGTVADLVVTYYSRR